VARIRDATRADNGGLLALTATTPMRGDISIRSDRYPDFFRLLDRRGPSHVLVAEEGERIVGCVSVAGVPALIHGEVETIHYLGDLKVHPDHQGTGLAVRLLKSMHRALLAAGADLVVCTAAYGNREVLTFFDGRAGLPAPVPLGVFHIYQLVPSRWRRATPECEAREEPDHPDLYAFYQGHVGRYQFGPVSSPGSLWGARHWVVRRGSTIRAALSLVDTWDARQNVLIRLPRSLGAVVGVLRLLQRIVPIAHVPGPGDPIRTLYVKALACVDGADDAVDALLRQARKSAFDGNYHFVAVGVHEEDPSGRWFAGIPKFTYKSLAFVWGLRRSRDELRRLTEGVPYEDYSLL
jgi:GNAT superfamily N-acetyltransferase